MIKNPKRFAFALIISYIAGYFGMQFTNPNGIWYENLIKPWFQPPAYVFGPVWLVLYTLMGIAFYLVWQSRANQLIKDRAVVIFGFHLFLNALWSYLFWVFEDPLLAYIDIMMMWITLLFTMQIFWHINKRSFYLLLPYLAWLTYACMLNYVIWQLNL